nr:MAG TPA: endopeptidase tail [Caudoviricetes sp.]
MPPHHPPDPRGEKRRDDVETGRESLSDAGGDDCGGGGGRNGHQGREPDRKRIPCGEPDRLYGQSVAARLYAGGTQDHQHGQGPNGSELAERMDVVYIFDAARRVRKVLPGGVSELVHKEADYELEAEVTMGAGVRPGEFLGFRCVDGRFRLFEVDETEEDDLLAVTRITATDAAAAELTEKVIEHVELTDSAPADGAAALLAGTAWEIRATAAGKRKATLTVYYQTAWEALRDMAKACAVRVVPYYDFSGGAITARCIDLQEMEPIFRGRIFDSTTDAGSVYLTRTGSPCTVAYGVGKATGEGNDPTRLTIAGVTWSKAGGDPADKPSGQTWIADEAALAKYGRKEMVFNGQEITDAAELLEKTWEALEAQREPIIGGTATVQDMEMLPGQSHRKIRLYDLVAVITRQGETFTSQVVDIERDYVRPEETKIKLGAEKDEWKKSLTKQIASIKSDLAKARGGAGRAGNSAEKNKELIVENMDLIRLHTIAINEQANKISETEIKLEKAKVRITANEKLLASQGERLNSTEILLNGSDTTIGLVAKVEANGQAISSASIRIDGQAAEIQLKVSKNGVISSINQTSESITISASKVNLKGYVTASDLSAEVANINKFFAGTAQAQRMDINNLTTQTFQATNVSLINYDCGWKTKTFVTGVSFPRYVEGTIYYKDQNGSNAHMTVLTPKKNSNGSVSSKEVVYLGRAIDD